MAKLRSTPRQAPLCPVLMGEIVACLLTEQREIAYSNVPVADGESVPQVTPAELQKICGNIRNSKASGSDGIPNRLKNRLKNRNPRKNGDLHRAVQLLSEGKSFF